MLTHRRPAETEPALMMLIELANEAGVTLRFDPEETAKHSLPDAAHVECDAPLDPRVDICFALGGDGTILNALRRYAGTGVPVFGSLPEHEWAAEPRSRAVIEALLSDIDMDAQLERLSGGERRRTRCARWPAISRSWRCPGSRSKGRAPRRWRSTTSRSTASRASGSRTWSTRSAAMTWDGSAATAWWCPRRPAPPATTSPTAAR